MTPFPVFIHQDNGHFVATRVGEPEIRTTAPTKAAALAEMQRTLKKRYVLGE